MSIKLKIVSKWLSNIKVKLYEIGIGYIWVGQDKICYKSHHLRLKRRIIDTFVQNRIANVNSSTKMYDVVT